MAVPISTTIVCVVASDAGPTQLCLPRSPGRVHRFHLPKTLYQAHGLAGFAYLSLVWDRSEPAKNEIGASRGEKLRGQGCLKP